VYALPLICLTLLLNDAVGILNVSIFNIPVSPAFILDALIWNEPDAEPVK